MIIKYNDFNFNIKLNNSQTSKAIQRLNDFKAKINTWGEEIYFETPLKTVKLEPNSRDFINLGEGGLLGRGVFNSNRIWANLSFFR
jgi:hypothetical protein